MSRIAVMDIGTQSILFLLAEYGKDKLHRIDQSAMNIRLGQLAEDQSIQMSRLENATRMLLDLKVRAETSGADQIIAVGTAVFRNASNGQDAAAFLSDRTGIPLEILSERDEALLSFKGAILDRDLNGDCWVFDVGGGSTECILGSEENVIEWTSLPLGAVVMNHLLRGDPPEPKAVRRMQDQIGEILSTYAPIKTLRAEYVLGVGGTLTTLAAMEREMVDYNPDEIDGMILRKTQLEKWMTFFGKTSTVDRMKYPGLAPERADIIMAGTSIFISILDITGHDRILVSDRGLRYGVWLREAMQYKVIKN